MEDEIYERLQDMYEPPTEEEILEKKWEWAIKYNNGVLEEDGSEE